MLPRRGGRRHSWWPVCKDRATPFAWGPPGSQAGRRQRRSGLLGHQHRVDQVDAGVGRLDAAADDAGAVNHQRILASSDGYGTALDSGVRAGNLVRRDLAGNHVVGQDLAQEGVVRLEGFDGGGIDLGEGVINRGKTVNSLPLRGVRQVNLRVQPAGDSRREGGQDGVVRSCHCHRVESHSGH